MSPSQWIRLNERIYSSEELKNQGLDEIQSDFERATLKFCKDWVNGQQEFAIQTSGSTGTPKSIVLLRSQMEANAKQTIEALQLKAGETSLVCLDTNYVAGKMMLVRSLIVGMNVIAVEPSANPFNKLEEQPVDFVALVPYQLEEIIEHSSEKLNQVRCAIVGGAAIGYSLNEKIKKSRCSIYATYGMTETISHIALQRLNGKRTQHYFKAFETIDLRLDDRGCLCVKAKYLDEEIITNDLAELIDGKQFKCLGRIDNVINSGGIKVIPEKVESALERILNSFQIINRFFITGIPDEKLGSKVIVVFEGLPFNKEIKEEILFEASQKISKYELPKEFLFIPKFRETATGKINRSATVSSIQ